MKTLWNPWGDEMPRASESESSQDFKALATVQLYRRPCEHDRCSDTGKEK